MEIKVSIIIPVYNVEKYIKKTIDSVVNQTLKEIEIIVIDNKSTDNTLKIAEEYELIDKRIVIYRNKSNIKQGLARNYGVEKAGGEYIFFLDGDDYIELNAIEKLYNKIRQTKADITICRWNRFNDKTLKIDRNHEYGKLRQIPNEFDNKTFNFRDIKKSLFWQTSVPWDKMYRRDFLIKKDVKFPGGIFFEDNVFVYDALLKAEKISILREDLIYYRYNRKDAVTNRRDETFYDYFKIFDLIKENLKKIGLYEEMKYLYWDYKVITLYWWFMKVKIQYKCEFFNRMKSDFKQLQMNKRDRECVRNRTLFLINRFTKMRFLIYYPFFFFFDKIFRIERGENNYTIVLFSTYEKWREYRK